jgi:catechol-2,3-dioxygenase
MHKKFDPKVFQLGYVALATPDLARAKDHYLETIGLTETDEARGEVYLSVGYEHHNIVLGRFQIEALVSREGAGQLCKFGIEKDVERSDLAIANNDDIQSGVVWGLAFQA